MQLNPDFTSQWSRFSHCHTSHRRPIAWSQWCQLSRMSSQRWLIRRHPPALGSALHGAGLCLSQLRGPQVLAVAGASQESLFATLNEEWVSTATVNCVLRRLNMETPAQDRNKDCQTVVNAVETNSSWDLTNVNIFTVGFFFLSNQVIIFPFCDLGC